MIRIGGHSSASMGWQETRDAISAALGPPQKTTLVGQGCETHVMPGFAITWKNLRVPFIASGYACGS